MSQIHLGVRFDLRVRLICQVYLVVEFGLKVMFDSNLYLDLVVNMGLDLVLACVLTWQSLGSLTGPRLKSHFGLN